MSKLTCKSQLLILTFRLRAFVDLLLLFLAVLSLTFVLLLDLLSHAGEDGLENDGVLIDLEGLEMELVYGIRFKSFIFFISLSFDSVDHFPEAT